MMNYAKIRAASDALIGCGTFAEIPGTIAVKVDPLDTAIGTYDLLFAVRKRALQCAIRVPTIVCDLRLVT